MLKPFRIRLKWVLPRADALFRPSIETNPSVDVARFAVAAGVVVQAIVLQVIQPVWFRMTQLPLDSQQ